MKPTPDQLLVLRREVEEQGGAPMPHACHDTPIHYDGPRKAPAHTQSCGEEALFLIPYDMLRVAKQKGAESRGGGFAVLCANCDSMALMPRFAAALREEAEE